MEVDGEEYVEAVEELAGSWQDIRGKDGLEDSRWETVAGGLHQDVVALDGTVTTPADTSSGGRVDKPGDAPLPGESNAGTRKCFGTPPASSFLQFTYLWSIRL